MFLQKETTKSKNIVLDNNLTNQRLNILDLLRNTDKHLTILEIYSIISKKFPKISLNSVYQTVIYLKNKGYILEIQSVDRKIRYDGQPVSHCHFICERCGTIINIESNNKNNNLPQVKMGGIIVCINNFYGLCRKCQEKS